MESGGASRTAVFVCQGRAVADGRLAPGRFADPVAASLLDESELAPVRMAREGTRPQDGRDRFLAEAVRACAEVVAPRTVAIDEAVADACARRPEAQVVLLGAGLDARPWRLEVLRGRTVLSVDHPASQADLRRRAAGLVAPLADLRYVATDLAVQPLAPALAGAGHDPGRTTVWVWEGVIPYLTPSEVAATLDAVSALSGEGSTLVAQYQSPSGGARLGRRVMGMFARLAGVPPILADEPWKAAYTAEQFGSLLAQRGWLLRDDASLLDHARRLETPTQAARSLATGRVAVARRG